jgi:DNA-directed RNA polymerase subunit E'/Rpb7
MFYNYGNLKTELTFSHYDMDKLHSDDEIIKKLKDKVEGRCLPDYGYLIQVTNPDKFKISVPHVQTHGCVVVVTFSAITFKRIVGLM